MEKFKNIFKSYISDLKESKYSKYIVLWCIYLIIEIIVGFSVFITNGIMTMLGVILLTILSILVLVLLLTIKTKAEIISFKDENNKFYRDQMYRSYAYYLFYKDQIAKTGQDIDISNFIEQADEIKKNSDARGFFSF